MFRSLAFYTVLAGLSLIIGGGVVIVSHPYLGSGGVFAGLCVAIFGTFRLPRLLDRPRR